jgi:hypothetical protein
VYLNHLGQINHYLINKMMNLFTDLPSKSNLGALAQGDDSKLKSILEMTENDICATQQVEWDSCSDEDSPASGF